MSQLDNYLIDNSMTNTIETYNSIKSPLIYNPDRRVKIKGNNWYIFTPDDITPEILQSGIDVTPEFKKQNLVENDSLLIRVDPINELRYKNITNITVSFKAIFTNHSAVPKIDSIKAVLFDKEYGVYFDRFIDNNQINTFNCYLFDVNADEIYNALQAYEFFIGINFNGNRSNCNIKIQQFEIKIEFENKLETEKKAAYSRLEEYFTDINNYVDDYKSYLFGSTTTINSINELGTSANPYKVCIDKSFPINVRYKSKLSLGNTTYPLKHQEIKWFMNNKRYNDTWDKEAWIDLGSTETNDEGNTNLALTVKEEKDFLLVAIFEGLTNEYEVSGNIENVGDNYKKYATIDKVRKDFEIKVIKFRPSIMIKSNKDTYVVNEYLDGKKYEKIVVDIDVTDDINGQETLKAFEEKPVKCKCSLVDNNGNIINHNYVYMTDEKIDFNGRHQFIFEGNYEGATKIRIELNGTDYTQPLVLEKNITIAINQAYVIKNYWSELSCSNNCSGDYLYFKIKDENNTSPVGDIATITVNGRVQDVTVNENGYAIFTNTSGLGKGSYNYRVVYKGGDIGNVERRSGFINTGVVSFIEWRWTAWHSFSRFTGGIVNVNNNNYSFTPDNSSSGEWLGWKVVKKTASCGKLHGTGKNGRHPRNLRISGLDTPFVGNIIATSVQIKFYDKVENDSIMIEPTIPVNDGWVIWNLKGYQKRGTKHNVKKGEYSEHTFTWNGSFDLNQCNSTNFTLKYGANKEPGEVPLIASINKKGKVTYGGKLTMEYGYLKVSSPAIRIYYRNRQQIW